MVAVHIAVGALLIALNLIAGAWGVVSWLRRRAAPSFWLLLRAAQGAVVVQAILGGLLLMTDHRAAEDLHYLYGVLPLVIALITETMRVGAAQSVVGDIDYAELPEAEQHALALKIFVAETRVMALGCLIIAALALRAVTTSGL